MATNSVDIDLLKRIEADLTQLRKDVLSLQQSSADVAGMIRRIDGRLSALERPISDVKLDLGMLFKLELMGQLAHHETRMENRFSEHLEAIRQLLDDHRAAQK